MTNFDQKTPLSDHPSKSIVIVSGLPRSGTSMMMKMLTAGGMDAVVDNIRTPDQDNPKGYFEFERVKNLPEGDTNWLGDCAGKVVKIIAFFIPYLPDTYQYQIVFMQRSLPEILASQMAMLENQKNREKPVNPELMTNIYKKHIVQVDQWIKAHQNVERIDIDHHELILNPLPQIQKINNFFQSRLDEERMRGVIDPSLYRQRKNK